MVDVDTAIVQRHVARPRASDENDQVGREIVVADQWHTGARSGFGFLSKVIGAVGTITLAFWLTHIYPYGQHIDPLDFKARTERVLATTPLIDGHNDLPYLLRLELKNQIYDEHKFSFREGKHHQILAEFPVEELHGCTEV